MPVALRKRNFWAYIYAFRSTRVKFDELSKVVTEMEAILNSRPLMYIYVAADEVWPHCTYDVQALMETNPDPDFMILCYHSSVTARMERIKQLLKHFWKWWRNEYLIVLREVHRFAFTTGSRGRLITQGDIVLVHDESYSRTYWKLGRVAKLIQVHDGQIRVAVVRVTSWSGTTTLQRPVQLIIPTWIKSCGCRNSNHEDWGNWTGCASKATQERCGRFGEAEDRLCQSIWLWLSLVNWGRIRSLFNWIELAICKFCAHDIRERNCDCECK